MAGINPLSRGVARIAVLFVITLIFAISVSAYTVVMRGGRRVEIPSSFVITRNTLTYEVSPGVQITLALAAIDITATEKANNENPGSLLGRAQVEARKTFGSPVVSAKTRTITNRDLESISRRRRQSEAAYELRRKELGLPTLEESRRRAAAVLDLTGTELEQKLIADQESEDYWRARASALRTEMATLDAELSYIRTRIEEFTLSTSTGWSATTGTFLPLISFGNVGRGQFFPGRGLRRPDVFTSPRTGSQLSGRVRFGGGGTRGQVTLNPVRSPLRRPFGYGRQGYGRHGFSQAASPYGPIALIGQPYDYSYERNALITHFNELAAARAGLNARWRELEDEARRAGAQPGWLRR